MSMSIRVTDLPREGIEFHDSLPLEALNARMNEADDNDILFVRAPEVHATFRPIAGGISFSGKISSSCTQPCARCSENLELPVETEFKVVLKPKSERQNAEDEEDVLYYEGDHFDVEDMLQENLIVALDPFYSPPCNKDGDCSVCKFNLNNYCDELETVEEEKTNLGDLLKKAMSKN
ncbi:MAG: DUF177 domain-containing protein [Bdellovibrionales bacterium]|nr:DUF177 domain-containing protein [Bdellovibrionales bacterium]